MPTTPYQLYTPQKQLLPYHRPEFAVEFPVRLVAGTYVAGTLLGEVTVNEIQLVTLTGATGGTFTLAYKGQTTSALAYNAAAATVQAALEALSTIGSGNVAVTGSAGGPYTVTFQGTLAQLNTDQLVANGAALTGTTPTAVVTTTTPGEAGLFKAYANGNSDGSQVAKLILRYGCTVASDGQISGLLEHGATKKDVPAYGAGYFITTDLTGLDAAAVTDLGRLVWGNVTRGLLKVY